MAGDTLIQFEVEAYPMLLAKTLLCRNLANKISIRVLDTKNFRMSLDDFGVKKKWDKLMNLKISHPKRITHLPANHFKYFAVSLKECTR